ncbi:MAG: endonuclease domain-containing protein [Thermincolia bacterium]
MEFDEKWSECMSALQPGEWKQIYFGTGTEMFVTPCADCKTEVVKQWKPKKNIVFKCKECREKEKSSSLKNQISELTKLRRTEDAKRIITRQFGSLEGYEKPFRLIGKKLNTPGWFQSTNEVLAAAELIRCKIKAVHQAKIRRWKADFVLPELKVVLEIDGGYHKMKPGQHQQEEIRDAGILSKLGLSWDVIRIDEHLIQDNLQDLVPTIKRIIAKKRKFRKASVE